MADQTESLFKSNVSAPAARAPAAPAEKLKLDGVVITKSGAVYFGDIAEDEAGIVTITVPTPTRTVRTVRRIDRAQVAASCALTPAEIVRLAKVGPHVISKADLDRLVPLMPVPEDGKPAAGEAGEASTTEGEPARQ